MINIEEMLKATPAPCPACGKIHLAGVKEACIESGAIKKLPAYIKKYGAKKAYILADCNTWKVAGAQVNEVLKENGIETAPYVLNMTRAEPDEHAIGSVAAHMDTSCDIFISVGSGVINDLGKIPANLCKLPYIIVGTAPSMDGYASGTSSIIRDGLKHSLPSKCADLVIGDLDVLCEAPMRMICAGVGDLFAKFISICEWRISKIITGEYFCEEIAGMVNQALQTCVDNLDGIVKRDRQAIKAVMDGMVLAGVSMNYATLSRPASGMEHYISHICDMRAVEFNTPMDLHGIQCGVATLLSLRIYEKLRQIEKPDREKALAYAKSFRYEDWKVLLQKRLGKSAEAMIEIEAKEHKYDVALHEKRLEIILDKWEEIREVMNTLPTADEVEALLRKIGAPTTLEELGFSKEDEKYAILMSKDIRDKYVGSRMLWDLGLLEEFV